MDNKPVDSRDFRRLLEFTDRFSHYQQIPPCALQCFPDDMREIYRTKQGNLDDRRYEWITANLHIENTTVADLGANLGYFTLRLASEFGAHVDAYEPLLEYGELIRWFSEMCDLDSKIRVHQTVVGRKEIDQLKKVELFLHLNVLHHAGVFFDQGIVNSTDDWTTYSNDHISQLSKVTKTLVIQVGNMWKGNVLFNSEESVPFITNMLIKNGWNVDKIGVISDFDSLVYETYEVDKSHLIPRVHIYRNEKSELVDYFIGGHQVASRESGLAQRPIFLCTSALVS